MARANEDPDFGLIISGETEETRKAGQALGGNSFAVESAWCLRCAGEDGDHTPTCKKNN